jgi:hypothetical protein
LPGLHGAPASGQIATHEMLEGAKARGHDFNVIPKPLNPLEILARVLSGLEFATSLRPLKIFSLETRKLSGSPRPFQLRCGFR